MFVCCVVKRVVGLMVTSISKLKNVVTVVVSSNWSGSIFDNHSDVKTLPLSPDVVVDSVVEVVVVINVEVVLLVLVVVVVGLVVIVVLVVVDCGGVDFFELIL